MTSAEALVGSRRLLRTSLRHEGRSFAPYVVIATALTVSSVIIYPLLFPDLQERKAFAATVGANPAIGLIFGPAYDLSTVDGFNAWRSLALGGFLTALGAILIVVKSSRGQEDSGQAELLASGVLGRQARLATALAMGLLLGVAVGAVAGVAAALCGGGWTVSLLLGAGFTVTGWMFAGVAALTAQIGADARTASSLAVAFLGILFALRGFLFSIEAPAWTTWANPLGWVQQTRPAAENDWWPLLLPVAFTLVMVGAAFALQTSRDFGQGLIAQRPGPDRGSARTVLALVMRLNRGSFIPWAAAFVGLGIIFGYFTRSAVDLLSANPAMAEVFASGAATPADLLGAFLTTVFSMVGIVAAVAGVQIVNRLRSEELEDRAEAVLATPVTRHRYLAGTVAVAFAAPAVFVVIAGLVIGIFAASADTGISFRDAVLQALVTIPAVWAVVAVAVAVIGARPEARLASWAGVIGSFGLTMFGPSFKLPGWALGISPFYHLPTMAADAQMWWGLLGVGVAVLVLLTIGFVGFRRRDTP